VTGVHTMPRVLIIEDHVANLGLVIGILESEGYQFLTAETAEQGLELAATERPDLILMDIHLPGMTQRAVKVEVLNSERLYGIQVFGHCIPMLVLHSAFECDDQLRLARHPTVYIWRQSPLSLRAVTAFGRFLSRRKGRFASEPATVSLAAVDPILRHAGAYHRH
jgi:CheY-like chemotaxis protein